MLNLRNYLRVRGEYDQVAAELQSGQELPPRTRRIQAAKVELWRQYGTTSAYAENTPAEVAAGGPQRNYLRVRGEYPK